VITTSRERVRKYLKGQISDGILLSCGALPTDGISAFAYAELLSYLGFGSIPIKVYDLFQFLAEIDPQIIDILGGDFVQVHRMRYRFKINGRDWREGSLYNGVPCLFPAEFNPVEDKDGDSLIYVEGEPFARMPVRGLYYDQIFHPLSGVNKIQELRNCHPAAPMDDDEIEYMIREIGRLYENTDKSIVLIFGASIFEQGQRDFGHEDFFCNLVTEPDLMHAYFQMVADANIKNLKKILDQTSGQVDVVHFFDDIGTQSTLQISPEMYREMIKPYHRQQCSFIHENYSEIKVLMHCCGAIFDLIPDYIEIGVDILNPVQISASGMDPIKLKNKYGKQIIFWGGGADTQNFHKYRTVDDVRQHVDELVKVFSQDGGYVFSQIHNFQGGTEPEKIMAVFETAGKYKYPEK
jgi:uroporphyrinogen decarboxylase